MDNGLTIFNNCSARSPCRYGNVCKIKVLWVPFHAFLYRITFDKKNGTLQELFQKEGYYFGEKEKEMMRQKMQKQFEICFPRQEMHSTSA